MDGSCLRRRTAGTTVNADAVRSHARVEVSGVRMRMSRGHAHDPRADAEARVVAESASADDAGDNGERPPASEPAPTDAPRAMMHVHPRMSTRTGMPTVRMLTTARYGAALPGPSGRTRAPEVCSKKRVGGNVDTAGIRYGDGDGAESAMIDTVMEGMGHGEFKAGAQTEDECFEEDRGAENTATTCYTCIQAPKAFDVDEGWTKRRKVQKSARSMGSTRKRPPGRQFCEAVT